VRARDASIDGLQAAPTHTNGDSTQAEETFALAFAGGGGEARGTGTGTKRPSLRMACAGP
jgi:hypothetical protein